MASGAGGMRLAGSGIDGGVACWRSVGRAGGRLGEFFTYQNNQPVGDYCKWHVCYVCVHGVYVLNRFA